VEKYSFGQLNGKTEIITLFPIQTDRLNVKLIDTPGNDFAVAQKFIHTKLVRYSNEQAEIKQDIEDPVLCQQ
jgi:septin family protein